MQKIFLFLLLPFAIWANTVVYERIEEKGNVIHLLFADRETVELSIVNCGDGFIGVECLSTIAKKCDASYGINGGFFRGGAFLGGPSGILKIEGVQFSSTDRTRGALGISSANGTLLIDRLDSELILQTAETLFHVDGINMPRKEGQAILYTESFGTHTPKQPQEGIEIGIRENGKIFSYKNTSENPIPKNGMVYSIDSAFEGALPAEGQIVTFSQKLLPQFHPEEVDLWNTCENILGATPVLIIDGHIVEDFNEERVLSTFLSKRFARSAIGLLDDQKTLVFAVVEGGNYEESLGMPMDLWAEFMLSLGCERALNLDGGGSSTMYIEGSVMTERPVGNVLLINRKAI